MAKTPSTRKSNTRQARPGEGSAPLDFTNRSGNVQEVSSDRPGGGTYAEGVARLSAADRARLRLYEGMTDEQREAAKRAELARQTSRQSPRQTLRRSSVRRSSSRG